MVRYLFYTIGDLTYQSPLVYYRLVMHGNSNIKAKGSVSLVIRALTFAEQRQSVCLGCNCGCAQVISSVLVSKLSIFAACTITDGVSWPSGAAMRKSNQRKTSETRAILWNLRRTFNRLNRINLQVTTTARGELSYLAPLGSENISAPYFKQCFFQGGGITPQTVKHHASQSQDRNNKYFILYNEFCINNKI